MGWQCHKMATSGAQSSYQDWRKSVTCRYFQYGLCKAGDSCQYAHDKTSAPPVMCKFFMKGKCRYGDECRFEHKMRPDGGAMPPGSPQPQQQQQQQQQQPQIIQIVPTQQIISAQPRPISQPLGPPPGTMQGRMVPLQKAMVGGPTMVGGPVVSMPGMHHMGMPVGAAHHMVVTSQMNQMGQMTMNQMSHMNQQMSQQMSHLSHMSQMNQQVHMQDYVNAAAFVPGQPYQTPGRHFPPSYLSIAQMGVEPPPPMSTAPSSIPPPTTTRKSPVPEQMQQQQQQQSGVTEPSKKQNTLCPFNVKGTCRYGANCMYLHGGSCDLCGEYCLHPADKKQNKEHRSQCMAEHEKNMQVAFAFQRSKDVACGICMEVILEKSSPKDRKFGLLSNCNHPYCLACIRKWRMAKQYEKKVVRGCPTCRVASHFVTPSDFWVEESDEKTKIVEKYKQALSIKPCKYFDQGRGTCPFGAECFYLHAYQDGSKEDRTKIRKYNNADGKLRTFRALQLWDFFEERDNRLLDWSSDDEDDWFLYYDWSDEFDYYSDFEDELWSDYFDFYGARSDDSDNNGAPPDNPPSNWVPIVPVNRAVPSSAAESAQATTTTQQQQREDGNDGDDESEGDAGAQGVEGAAGGGNEETAAEQTKLKEAMEELSLGVKEDLKTAKEEVVVAATKRSEGNEAEEEEFEDCLSDEFAGDW